jgi:hypothetical protein
MEAVPPTALQLGASVGVPPLKLVSWQVRVMEPAYPATDVAVTVTVEVAPGAMLVGEGAAARLNVAPAPSTVTCACPDPVV